VCQGVPFRQAHHLVGEAVSLAEKRAVPITTLKLADWKKISPVFTPAALKVFTLGKALAARPTHGSPNPRLVKAQLARWTKTLSSRKA
jgi:argininosuccinate lyase